VLYGIYRYQSKLSLALLGWLKTWLAALIRSHSGAALFNTPTAHRNECPGLIFTSVFQSPLPAAGGVLFLTLWHRAAVAATVATPIWKSAMSKSLKAAALSAFVFPGAGHLYLKRYIAAAVLATAAFASLYVLFSQALELAMQLSEQIQAGEVALDPSAIAELVSRQVAGSDTQQLTIASYGLLICWLLGIVDAFRVGRTQGRGSAKGG
jgi:hypothetical protein